MEQPKKINRPDTPLAATPEPKRTISATINPINGKVSIGGVDLKDIKKPKMLSAVKEKLPSKGKNVQKVAMGVVISKKDEKAHPEDFKYLNR
jgi:hypothetical protein